ncbi:constitutive coactivator of PPAR-gamma-like protein 1 homolog [Eucyclogobius newberryi]|uniref:constitutive coactivator of PPAR-gamma-like protein 1 homolog n=1 Tax=Eucyclogobius newberryi TaxID=166745 RepID=UPI003B5BCD88
MGVQDFQEFIEKHCPAAVAPVELQTLARGALVGGSRHRGGPLRLLLDAESCLHRLYGGSYTDWVSGGQWNHMLSFLAALSQACFGANIQFVVCFNGALEKSRLHEWVKRQGSERQTAQQILCHVHNKGTPPPKVWFLPPVCMAHCVRLALLRVGVGVVQTVEDHHLEVLALFRKNGFHGLVAYDSDYALSNISQYFSSQALKLSRNGKSITTRQFLLQEVAKHLNINPSSFAVFAALLGNHILLDEDLAAFYWTLLGPEHPLASLKVRAHQLVLPPCDVVIRAVAVYVRNIKDITDLDAIAKDVFKNFQSCTLNKVVRFQRAVEYYSVTSRSPSLSPHADERPNHVEGSFGVPIKSSPKEPNISLVQQSVQSVKTSPSHIFPEGDHTPLYERASAVNPGPSNTPLDHGLCNTSPDLSLADNDESLDTTANDHDKSGSTPNSEISADAEPKDQIKPNLSVSCDDSLGPQAKAHQTHIPSLLSMPIRSHMDVTIPALPEVAYEVLRIAEHRHKNGLMYPYIYHVLSKGEIKLSVTIEDDNNTDLPPAVRLFRPIRQYVYGVLFSLVEARRKAERLAVRKNCLPEYNLVLVKEWAAYKGKAPHTPELVEALPFREWTCPSLKKLWLGKAVEDKNRRMRAFLACMRSDTPAMLNPSNIPMPFLVLCCVLRFMLQWPGIRVLRRNELDAFLAQALSPKLFEHELLQELKIDNLDPRGIQLAALFMSGVDMALFANDACGQPVPWEHCCPWMYFDGKLFQSLIIRANQGHVPLIDLCDGQAEQVAKVEKMRQSILEGLNFPCPPHPLPFPVPPLHRMPLYPPGSFYQLHPMFPTHQGRGQRLPRLSQGGKLEIAGTVVGQWAGTKHGRERGGFPVQVVSVGGLNKGRPKGVLSTPLFRTFGRGGYFYSQAFKNQAVHVSKPAHIPITVEHNAKIMKSNLEDKEPEELDQPHSALMCNTHPLLNALTLGGDPCQNEALEAAVLKEE